VLNEVLHSRRPPVRITAYDFFERQGTIHTRDGREERRRSIVGRPRRGKCQRPEANREKCERYDAPQPTADKARLSGSNEMVHPDS